MTLDGRHLASRGSYDALMCFGINELERVAWTCRSGLGKFVNRAWTRCLSAIIFVA